MDNTPEMFVLVHFHEENSVGIIPSSDLHGVRNTKLLQKGDAIEVLWKEGAKNKSVYPAKVLAVDKDPAVLSPMMDAWIKRHSEGVASAKRKIKRNINDAQDKFIEGEIGPEESENLVQVSMASKSKKQWKKDKKMAHATAAKTLLKKITAERNKKVQSNIDLPTDVEALMKENKRLKMEVKILKQRELDSEELRSSLRSARKILKMISNGRENNLSLPMIRSSSPVNSTSCTSACSSSKQESFGDDTIHPHLLNSAMTDGVTELHSGSGIYVRRSLFNTLKSTAQKGTSMARGLMPLVFSQHALTSCSLKGGIPKGPLGTPLEKRDGLFGPGVQAIFAATLEIGKAKGWKENTAELSKAMGTKLCEYRADARRLNVNEN